MDKCSKCFQPIDKIEIRSHWGEAYKFCPLCSVTLDRLDQTGVIDQFLMEDFGELEIPKLVKDMINARILRAKGKGPWVLDLD